MSPTSRRSLAVALAVAAGLAPAACSPSRESPPAAAPDSSFAAIAFQRARPPVALSEEHGRVVYDHYCSICHGETGGGDGFNSYNVSAAYGVSPTAFDDSTTFRAMNADTALAMIREGGAAVGRSPAMPPWGNTLTAGEVFDVWQYVGTLARKEGPH